MSPHSSRLGTGWLLLEDLVEYMEGLLGSSRRDENASACLLKSQFLVRMAFLAPIESCKCPIPFANALVEAPHQEVRIPRGRTAQQGFHQLQCLGRLAHLIVVSS